MPLADVQCFDGAVPVSFYDQQYFTGVTSNYKNGYNWSVFGSLFEIFADCLIQAYPEAESFLDLGCASGLLVRALREREVLAWGIDCSSYALSQADPAIRPFLSQGNLATCAFPPVDMIIAAEVLEHLTRPQLALLLPRLLCSTRLGLLATIPMPCMLNRLAWEEARRDVTHVSLHDRPWWTTLFQEVGWQSGVNERLAERFWTGHPLFLHSGWHPLCAGVPYG
jgi:SAM-dependent methyltransferase